MFWVILLHSTCNITILMTKSQLFQPQKNIYIIFFNYLNPMYFPTLQTFIYHNVFSMFYLKINWLHQPPAFIHSIPWIDIYMFWIQTFRTMIGITIARNFKTTILTYKIFNCPLKFFNHEFFSSLPSLKRYRHLPPFQFQNPLKLQN